METFLLYIGVILIAILVVLITLLWRKLKSNYPFLKDMIDQGIYVAEQLYPAQGSGPDKKAWVISWIKKKLNYMGSEEELSELIDKAVAAVNGLVEKYSGISNSEN